MDGQFDSVRDLMEVDDRTPLAPADLDDRLWFLLANRISSPAEAARYPEPVSVYYASRYLQWEVGNGGFAQAAYNIPEWFPLAEAGYRALGKPVSAALIRDVMKLLPKEQKDLERQGLYRATIGRVFEHFRDSRMAAMDIRIVSEDWEIDDLRVVYVRHHRDAFASSGV